MKKNITCVTIILICFLNLNFISSLNELDCSIEVGGYYYNNTQNECKQTDGTICANKYYGKMEDCESEISVQKNERTNKNTFKAYYFGKSECPEECKCSGSIITCQMEEEGRELTVQAGDSGNTIVQTKGVNMTTNVTLYHRDGKTFGEFKTGEKEIKIFPDQIQEKIRERIKQKTCKCDKIELTENALYEVQTQKQARLFWIFPIREKTNVQIDTENGEIIKFRNPWWGFLAKDSVDE